MGENDGNMVRFRLLFDGLHLLDKSQCSQGLRRCWFLLKPDITNIGDLASQIRKCFGLRNRIVLYMDDFVLPSFESTCIITDRDIIWVKRKEAKEMNICKPCDDQNVLQDSEFVMMHDMDINKNILANGSYDKEILTSCMENSVHLDPPCEVGSTKGKGKHSNYEIDKASSAYQVYLCNEIRCFRDEFEKQVAKIINQNNKHDQDFHDLQAQIATGEYKAIKYCFAGLVSLFTFGLTAFGLRSM